MAAEATEKKSKSPKPNQGPEKKPKKEKKAKDPAAEAAPPAAAPAAPAPPPAPRAPADPRLKVLKKFAGRFLPKGVLRDRHAALMTRWNSGDDHGNVTVEELKILLDEWKGTREKPPRKPKA